MPPPRWVKPAGATRHPRALAAVVVASRPAGPESRTGRQPTTWACAAATVCRFRGGRWSHPATSTFSCPSDLWAWLERESRPRSPLWVVSPFASASLTLAGFWGRLSEHGAVWNSRPEDRPKPGPGASPAGQPAARPPGGCASGPGSAVGVPAPYTISALVCRGKPDIVRYSRLAASTTWVSCGQFFDVKEESLAQTIGYQWPRSGGPVPPGAVVLRDPADRAELWCETFRRLFDWWREADGGPFGPTPGACANSYFRKRIKPKTLLSHADDFARQLDEDCLFGGRATTWHYGGVGPPLPAGADDPAPTPAVPTGPLPAGAEHWDVAGMYPSLLLTQEFPVRHLYNYQTPSLKRLDELTRMGIVLARVRLRTERAEYPTRAGGRVVNPVGEFDAALCGPELLAALRGGEVVACHAAALYAAGRPFAAAAGELLAARAAARAAGDPCREMFVKLLSNSFCGKLAQRRHDWKRAAGATAELEWGEWVARHPDTGRPTRWRGRSGLVEYQSEPGVPRRPLAACFAVLTSHGRYLMRLIRESLPAGSVLSQDTDGVWVTPAAGRVLEGSSMPQGYSTLRLRRTTVVTRLRFFGPRHYWSDDGWTLAGMHDPRRWSDGLTFRDSHREVPARTGGGRPPEYVVECQTVKRIGEIPADGTVGPDGWLVPYRHHPRPTSPPAGPAKLPL